MDNQEGVSPRRWPWKKDWKSWKRALQKSAGKAFQAAQTTKHLPEQRGKGIMWEGDCAGTFRELIVALWANCKSFKILSRGVTGGVCTFKDSFWLLSVECLEGTGISPEISWETRATGLVKKFLWGEKGGEERKDIMYKLEGIPLLGSFFVVCC